MKLLPDSKRRKLLAKLYLIFLASVFIFMFAAWNVMFRVPGTSYSGPFAPLSDIELSIRDQLEQHVRVLAEEIGIRSIDPWAKMSGQKDETLYLQNKENLNKAADYIQSEFAKAGYAPTRQTYEAVNEECYNIEAELTGSVEPDEIIVIGAHYDTYVWTPGADDNASGVAAVLALARAFAGRPASKTIRFVAFTNEEPPFFQSPDMGSLVYARACRERNENITAMLSLEMLGYYSDEHGSQGYPFPFNLLYPSTGDFIAFVSNIPSRTLMRRAVGTFRETMQFPSQGGAAPEWIQGIGWSDQWSFWQAGYPAIMVTDTSLNRYAHYHRKQDTIDKLNFDRMARVVCGLGFVVADLSGFEKEVWNAVTEPANEGE